MKKLLIAISIVGSLIAATVWSQTNSSIFDRIKRAGNTIVFSFKDGSSATHAFNKRWQLKQLSSPVSSNNTSLTAINFSNLDPTKTYRISGTFYVTVEKTSGNSAEIEVKSNLTDRHRLAALASGGTVDPAYSLSFVDIFTGITQIEFVTRNFASGDNLNAVVSGINATWTTIEEIDPGQVSIY